MLNWMMKHDTLKFAPSNMNPVLVETWEYFKLSPASIAQDGFKKTHMLLLYPPDQYMNPQACLADTKNSKVQKSDEI